MADEDAYAVGESRRQSAASRPQQQPEPSLAQLLGSLIGDAQTLVRREIDLARAEITSEISKARRGAVMLGTGAGVAAVGAIFLLIAVAELLVALNLLDRWVAYLLVGGTCAIVGSLVLIIGVRRFQEVDPVPHETIDSIRKDVSWVSEQTPSDRT
jgi:hypothetical protein